MWAAGLACLLTLACVVAALSRARRLAALQDGRDFKDRMGRASVPRLQQLRIQVDPGPGRELLDAVLDSQTPRQAIAEVNAVVGDLKYELVGAHEVAKSAGRIALAGGGMLAILQLIQFLRGGAGLASVLLCLTAALVGGLVCTTLARTAQMRARRQLEAWNQVTHRLVQIAEERFVAPPGSEPS